MSSRKQWCNPRPIDPGVLLRTHLSWAQPPKISAHRGRRTRKRSIAIRSVATAGTRMNFRDSPNPNITCLRKPPPDSSIVNLIPQPRATLFRKSRRSIVSLINQQLDGAIPTRTRGDAVSLGLLRPNEPAASIFWIEKNQAGSRLVIFS